MGGPARAKAVRPDAVEGIAPAGEVVAGGTNLDDASDSGRRHLLQDGAVLVRANGGVTGKVAKFPHEVGHCLHRVEAGDFGIVVVEDGVFLAVLLVRHVDGHRVGGEEGGKGAVVGQAPVVSPEFDVLFAKGDSLPRFGRGGVLSDAEKEEKGNDDQVCGDADAA